MNLDRKALGLVCLLLLAGCSSGLEGVDKRLSDMQQEITKLQSQNDRLVERVDAMETRQAPSASAATAAANKSTERSAVPTATRPSLKVVKVVPEDDSGMPSPAVGTQPPGEAADDPSPRPLIKLHGGKDQG